MFPGAPRWKITNGYIVFIKNSDKSKQTNWNDKTYLKFYLGYLLKNELILLLFFRLIKFIQIVYFKNQG